MPSATDQSTTVLMNRKMKTERGFTVSDAGCSSVAGISSIISKDSITRKIDILRAAVNFGPCKKR